MSDVLRSSALTSVEGVQSSLSRSEATVLLGAVASRGVSVQTVSGPFHPTSPTEGVTVKLQSTDKNNRILRLSVGTRSLKYREGWARWIVPARRASDEKGGNAAEAQDGVLDDGGCRILLLPGETREAILGFEVPLDGVNAASDLDLYVDVTDEEKKDPSTERLPLRLRLRHPDSGFLRALPALYSEAMMDLAQEEEDRTQPPFFERFLRGFEDGLEPLWAVLDHMERIIGPYTTPASFLPFLAGWTAMPFEEGMSEMSRRRYIAEAVALVRWRGTARGLRHLLRIVVSGDCRIDEASVEGMRLGEAGVLGAASTKLGNVGAHFFRVTLTVPDPDRLDVQSVHRAIAWCKPAHTVYELVVVGLTPN